MTNSSGASAPLQTRDAVFFDLDGTLTDPKAGITRSIQYALGRLDRAVPPEDDLVWCIGPPLRASFAMLLGGEAHADRAVALYRERFADIGLYENAVYPGIDAVLSALRAGGVPRLYIATSKPTVYAERIIDHFGLRAHFVRVFGSELDGTRTDKGELLGFALQQTGCDPARAVMIGDRKHDILGARRNAMRRAIGVLYGYGSRAELVEAGAHHLCATPQDVLDDLLTPA